MTACLIYSTHPTIDQARATAKALLDGRLAACCNILPAMESHYVWLGKPETATEVLMLSKTTQAQATAAMAAIKSVHPSQCPAILQLPVSGGHADFLGWIAAQSGGEGL